MLYDTTLLRTFVAICDAGSFTRAAREVNLTQSAVSHHVKRLEDQVGVHLIVRNTRGLRLTEKGEILLCFARRILALYQEAQQTLSSDREGLLSIGAPEFFDMQMLSSLLAQLSDRYPTVSMRIELGIGPDISALLDEGGTRSRDRRQRARPRTRRLLIPRAPRLGRCAFDATFPGRTCAACALSPLLPLAEGCPE